jgi:hypothetical protein
MGLADETGGLFRFSAKWVDKTLGREARRRGESMETIPIDWPSWHDAGSCVHRAPTRRLLAGAY